MSGETGKHVSGWTTDTLHVHIQRQLDDMRATLQERYETQARELQNALGSAEKAVEKAETAAEKRFDAVNEFRKQLGDQAATFVSRAEHDANSLRLAERIRELTDRINRTDGQTSGSSNARNEHRLNLGQALVAASVAIGMIAVIVTIFLSKGV